MSLFVLLALFICAVDAATRHHDCMCFPPLSVPQTAFCSNQGLTEFRGCLPLNILGINPLVLLGGDSFTNRQHYRLQLVRLDHNRMKEISGDSFSDLQNLEEVDLSYNIIQKRIPPETFENNSKMRSINLSHNKLGVIDERPIVVSHTAEIFKATNCEFIKIDSSTFVLPELRKLNLSSNDINKFETSTLTNFAKISTLDLSFNNIEIFSVNFSVAVNLEFLDMSHNRMETTKSLPLLSNENLQTLNVSGCGLKILRNETFDTPKIKALNVSNNGIEILLENTFVLMPHLNSLDLSKNKFMSLDFSLDLPDIRLIGNPWMCDCEFLNPHMTTASFDNALCFGSESVTGIPVSKFHNGDYCCKINSTGEGNSNLPITPTETTNFVQPQTEVIFHINATELEETLTFQKVTDISNPLQSTSHIMTIVMSVCVVLACLFIVYFIITIYRRRNLSTKRNKSIRGSDLSLSTYKQVAHDCYDKIERRYSPNYCNLQENEHERKSNDYTSDPTENIYEEILD